MKFHLKFKNIIFFMLLKNEVILVEYLFNDFFCISLCWSSVNAKSESELVSSFNKNRWSLKSGNIYVINMCEREIDWHLPFCQQVGFSSLSSVHATFSNLWVKYIFLQLISSLRAVIIWNDLMFYVIIWRFFYLDRWYK